MVYLPPVVRSLISDTIGKQPFTEICKRKGSIPRTLFPTIKSQINVIYQEFSPYIQYIRFSLQSGRGIIIPIRYGSILQHHPISICRSQHCFQRIQFFTFKGIVIRHIFYQETSGFIFFRLIFIMFQYLFQFAFVGCSTLQCVLQSAGSIASLNIPAINNIQSNLNRTFILVYSFKDTFPSHFSSIRADGLPYQPCPSHYKWFRQ